MQPDVQRRAGRHRHRLNPRCGALPLLERWRSKLIWRRLVASSVCHNAERAGFEPRRRHADGAQAGTKEKLAGCPAWNGTRKRGTKPGTNPTAGNCAKSWRAGLKTITAPSLPSSRRAFARCWSVSRARSRNRTAEIRRSGPSHRLVMADGLDVHAAGLGRRANGQVSARKDVIADLNYSLIL